MITGCGCLLASTRASTQPSNVTPNRTLTMIAAVLYGLFFLMAVMVGKKYMYKTKNKAATAKIIWIGERLLKCVCCIIRPRHLKVYSKISHRECLTIK